MYESNIAQKLMVFLLIKVEMLKIIKASLGTEESQSLVVSCPN